MLYNALYFAVVQKQLFCKILFIQNLQQTRGSFKTFYYNVSEVAPQNSGDSVFSSQATGLTLMIFVVCSENEIKLRVFSGISVCKSSFFNSDFLE